MSLREKINQQFNTALKNKEKTLVSTLRLIMAAIKDKDIADRSKGNNNALNRTNNLLNKYKSILSLYYCYHLLGVKVAPFVIPINVDQFQLPFKLPP